MVFEIPLADGSTVYMQGSESNVSSIVWVSSKKFQEVWDILEQKAINARKYQDVTVAFLDSVNSPVHLAEAGDLLTRSTGSRTLRMVDGVTRTQWLIAHGAQSFPVSSSHFGAPELLQRAGM